jgi:phage FluMu protein Com
MNVKINNIAPRAEVVNAAQLKMSDRTREALGSSASERDVRCECGSLLARWLEDQVELKCRRCKRVVLVDFRTRTIAYTTVLSDSSPRDRRRKG